MNFVVLAWRRHITGSSIEQEITGMDKCFVSCYDAVPDYGKIILLSETANIDKRRVAHLK